MMNRYFILLFVLFSSIGFSQENQTDSEGRKQGYWVKKYSNGNVQYKGTFKDDKPVGEFFHYDYKLNIVAKVNHVSLDTAYAKIYHRNGKVSGEGVYVNEEKFGVWKFYDDRAKLSAVEEFKTGVRNGRSETFYLNGQVSRKTYFVDGLENGSRIDFYESGEKRLEGNVVDGVFDGLVVYYRENGKKRLEGNYRNAVRDGIWQVYDERGLLSKKLDYKLGVLPKEQQPKRDEDNNSPDR